MSRDIPRHMPQQAAHTPIIQRSAEAKDNPVVISKAVETSQQDVGQHEPRVMRSTGPAAKALDTHQNIQVVDRPLDQEKLAMLMFMEELVEVKIPVTTDKNKEPCFEINVNGNLAFFRRGETKVVKRYIVDRMLRLKETVYTQREVTNADGVKEFIHDPHTGLKYDFVITRDDNPLGKSWERAVLAERG